MLCFHNFAMIQAWAEVLKVKFRRNLVGLIRINEHKFDQRSEVCKHLSANPTHRFNFKQPEILGSIAGQK